MLITGWVVTLTCYVSHSAKHRKWQISTPQGAKTPEPILMKPAVKMGKWDYVQDPTPHFYKYDRNCLELFRL